MATSTCPSCIALLHAQLRRRLSFLASLRSRSQVRSHAYQTTADPPDLAYHWDTTPPTPSQLQSATSFIKTHPPRKLWTATEWRKQNQSDPSSTNALGPQLIPEVTFLGRSNVGKSSLLNAVLDAPLLNRVGPRPGKTTTMHAWALSASNPQTGGAGPRGERDARLAVLDMPGYGFGSRDEWGSEIVTYLRRRKQLRRAFVLVDGLHGIKASDVQMVNLLRKEGISYQIIVSKADRLLATSKSSGNERLQAFFRRLRNDLVQPEGATGVAGLGEILAVGGLEERKKNQKRMDGKDLGIEQVRWAVLVAAGLEAWATQRASSTTSDKGKKPNKPQPETTPPSPPPLASTPSTSNLIPAIPQPSPKSPALNPIHSRSPHSTQTSHPSSSISFPIPPTTSTTTMYNPIGRLANFEAQSSLRNHRKPPHQTKNSSLDHDHDHGSNRASQNKSKHNKKQKSLQRSENLRQRRREMEADAALAEDRDQGMAWVEGGEEKSMGRPSAMMVDGKGVGGMADLLAMSAGRSAGGGKKRNGVGSRGGRGKGREREREGEGGERADVRRW